MSVRIDLDAFSQLTRRYGRPSPVGFQARSLQKPRKSVSSTTRCRLSSARGCSLVQHDFNTVYSGPDWKGTPGVSLRAPKVLLVDHEMQHRRCTRRREKKRKKRREGQGKETPVEPLEMSVGWYLRQAGSFRSNKAAPSSVRKRAWILINIVLPLVPFTLI